MPILQSIVQAHDIRNDQLALLPEHLAGFKRSQQIAYAVVTAVESQLQAGMTERDAAAALHAEMQKHGVREYFHQPFAWFGERTAFTGFKVPLQFFPTFKRLEPGMPVILDIAPIVDGHASDIGYACKLGDNTVHDQMLQDLAPYRTLILEGVRAGKNLDAIYRDVDRLIDAQGYRNRHAAYPFSVLAHRVSFVPAEARTEFKLAGFGVPAISYLFGQLAQARRGVNHVTTPLWNGTKHSAHPATPGLWAVEPHIGFRGIGVKWEELLVVTEHDAYWLDDDLPHVRRWSQAKSSAPKTTAQQVHV